MAATNTTTDNRFLTDSASILLGRAYYMHLGVLDRALKAEGLDKKLRPGMCNVLFALLAQDDQTISSIAISIRVAKSTMTGTVARLKEAGLIRIKEDSKDKRAQRLNLTAKARKLQPALTAAAVQVEDSIGAKMLKAERQEFTRLLNLAIDTMSNGDAPV